MTYGDFIRHVYFPFVEFIKGEKIRAYTTVLEANQYRPCDEILVIQWSKLKNLISQVYQSNPYYHQLLKERDILPGDINSPEEFAQIPYLTKGVIRDHGPEILNPEYRRKIYLGKTSGSTGIPLQFYCISEYNSWDWASKWRGRSWFNVNIGDSEVAIWGRPLYSTIKKFLDPIKARIRNTLLISGFEFPEENLDKFSKNIKIFNPIYIYGYSENIYQLALYFKDH